MSHTAEFDQHAQKTAVYTAACGKSAGTGVQFNNISAVGTKSNAAQPAEVERRALEKKAL